jgi:hypothetical protein
LFISFFEGRMFSCWIGTIINSTRGTMHCRATRILRGDQLVISGQYPNSIFIVHLKIFIYSPYIMFSFYSTVPLYLKHGPLNNVPKG